MIRLIFVVVLAIVGCYDHLHPPVTSGGNPADLPPVHDRKVDAGGQ